MLICLSIPSTFLRAQDVPVPFLYYNSGATTVTLRAEFNDWADGVDLLIGPHENGWWSLEKPLPPGAYKYKFYVDDLWWLEDPRNPVRVPPQNDSQFTVSSPMITYLEPMDGTRHRWDQPFTVAGRIAWAEGQSLDRSTFAVYLDGVPLNTPEAHLATDGKSFAWEGLTLSPGSRTLRVVVRTQTGTEIEAISNFEVLPERDITRDFYVGADISWVSEIEDLGGVYRDGGSPEDVFAILKRNGANMIRLRLWHTPTGAYSNLSDTLELATRIKAHNMAFLLDFHYSDWWADPGQQNKPAAWSDLTGDALKAAVYDYTKQTVETFVAAGLTPDMIQTGNEIDVGFLWPDGRINGVYNTPQQWATFCALMDECIRGVRDATPPGQTIPVMIHAATGGNISGSAYFYSQLAAQLQNEYDVIGLSFYPWWHGSLGDLRANLENLAPLFGKRIMVVETAYPWTLQWFDNSSNFIGLPTQLLPGYSASPQSQRDYLADVVNLVLQTPNNLGHGVIWWEPAVLPLPPAFETPWENLGWFDQHGNLLPAASVLNRFLPRTPLHADHWQLY